METLKKINHTLSKLTKNDFVFAIVLIALFIMHLRPISSFYLVRLIAPSVLFYLLISSGLWYLKKEGIRKLLNPCILIYFLFLIYSYVLIYIAPSSYESKKVFAQFFIGFTIFIIAYLMFNQPKYIASLILFYITLAVILSTFGIFQYHFYFKYLLKKYEGLDTSGDQLLGGILYALKHKRIGSTFGAANIFAGFLTITFPFFIYALTRSKKLLMRISLALLLIIFLYGFFLTSSRGGLLTLIFSFFITSFLFSLKDKRLMKKFLIVFLALIILATIILLLANIFWQEDKQQEQGIQSPSFFDRLLSSSTIRDRITYLTVGIQLFLRNPLIGYGHGSYAILCTQFLPTTSGSKFTHNFIIQLLCETGIIGTTIFLLFALLTISTIFKSIYKSQNEKSEYSFAKITVLASILTFLFNGLLEYSFYFEELFIDWMLLSGMALGLTLKDTIVSEQVKNQSILENDNTTKSQKQKPIIHEAILFSTFSALLLWGVIYTICLPTLSDLYEERGRSFYNSGNDKYANYMLNKSLSFCKDNYKAYIGLSHLYMSPPYLNPAQTIYYLKEAVKYNPYQSYIHDDLGNFYLNLGMFKEAYEEIELAVKYFPANIKYKEDLEKVKSIQKIK